MKATILVAALLSGLLVLMLALLPHAASLPGASPSDRPVDLPAAPATPRGPTRIGVAQLNHPNSESETNTFNATNFYARLSLESEPRRVHREQLDAYLAKHQRSVGALLGALRASGDETFLTEAITRFPDDPRVQFAAAFKSESAEERQQWLEKFKQSEPENSLANYLLAGEHLQAGRIEAALQELATAGGKAGFDNHLLEYVQDAEEAYHSAGFSAAEAKGTACWSALLPELARLKQLGVDLVDVAKRYDQAGEASSAQAVREMGMILGRRLDGTAQPTLIQELVGSAIERIILNSMHPDAPYGAAGQTVKSAADAIAQRRKSIRELNAQAETILTTLTDRELAHYFDRLKLYGEVAALRWVVSQSPAK